MYILSTIMVTVSTSVSKGQSNITHRHRHLYQQKSLNRFHPFTVSR